ncbi:hypothetical protein PHG11b_40 [Flavobacterium phage 11b]|uniref:hypothetical protein n=1 Tax=Flavobacterium phage 11b TaxID=294631 RepID=UPI0000444146|nr:hypothetical protein PHG11b_40 [Flavobacterium phage 11b]CAH56667.1 conserved hypothetical protein [Flavobacterium phage 11b]
MAKLEVQIGADSSELSAEISAAEAKIKRLGKLKVDRVKLGLDVGELTADINTAKAQLKGLNKSVSETGTAFSKMQKPVQNGGNTLMQFSRIAQDAPFGIMGIGNNITATAESFSYLSKSSGGAGNALKAVASSMLGTGGILLAVSLVTSALTYMSQNGITVGDVFDKLTGNFNEFGNAMKKAAEESTKSAIEEVGALQGLIAVAQSDTVSRKARTQAVKDLQSQYPAYFGNLSKEQIMYGNLSGTIKDVTQALINKGIAEKLTKDAVEPTLNLWRANGRLKESLAEQIKLQKDLAKETNARIAGGFGGRTNEEVSLMNNIKNTKLAITTARSDIKDLTVVVDSYKKGIVEASKASSDLLIKTPSKTASAPSKTSLSPLTSSLVPIDNEKIKKDGEKVVKLLGESVGNALAIFKETAIPVQIPIQPIIPEHVQTDMEKALIDLNNSADDLIQNSLGNTFSNLGTMIGESLATGGNVLSAIGQTLIQGLAGFLSDMGGLLIKYGTLAIVKGNLDIAIATGGPFAIAAGVAAIGVGIALKAVGGAIGSTAKGGQGGGGGISTGASVSSPRSSSTSNSSGGFQNVVFEISGQSLIGVLSSTLDKNRRLGGGLRLAN